MLDVDVAIIGAGPAGSAAALALRQHAPDRRVLLIDADRVPRRRGGEVLPAAGAALLQTLGVAAEVSVACTPAPGLAACWGAADVTERAAIFSAQGADWHLDRVHFDQLLADAAATRGAALWRGVRVESSVPLDTNGWRLSFDICPPLTAKIVIWATGRRRGFLGAVGGRAQTADRLIAYLRYYSEGAAGDPRTLLEACPDGWWYGAALPGGGRCIGFLTDADLGRPLGLATPEGWERKLAETRLMSASFGSSANGGKIEICAATSSLITPVCGPTWIAAGDAACTFEPLSSQGIAKALRSGSFAAYAALDHFAGKGEAARQRYSALIAGEYAAYQRTLARHYAEENRWPDHPFWARRRQAVAA